MPMKKGSGVGRAALEGFAQGLAVVVFAFVIFLPIAEKWGDSKWLWLAGITLFVFGDVLYKLRGSLNQPRLWFRFSTALAVHLLIGVAIVLWIPVRHPISSWAAVVFIVAEIQLVQRVCVDADAVTVVSNGSGY